MTSVHRRQAQPTIVTPSHADDDSSHGFLTAEEAAIFLARVNPRTLTRWARTGLIPTYPLGEGRRRLWRFRRADLLRWMQSRCSCPDQLADRPDWSRLFPATDAADQRTIQ
jgi:Helix-turn-helix domain